MNFSELLELQMLHFESSSRESVEAGAVWHHLRFGASENTRQLAATGSESQILLKNQSGSQLDVDS